MPSRVFPSRWLLLVALPPALAACSRAHAPLATGAQPARVAEPCARAIALTPGAVLRADSSLGSHEFAPSCVRGSAPACVFSLDVAERSELRVSLESSNFDGALALYGAGEPPRELRCVDDAPSGDVHHARFELAVAPGRYWVVVDGTNGEAGEFELFSELEPLPSVSAACARPRELASASSTRDSTRGGINLFSATCGGGAQGPEHVYELTLERPGRIRVRQQAEYDGSLYLRAHCEDASSELACNDDFGSSARSLISAKLNAGAYYLFSDSYSREQSGPYVLALERIDEPEPLGARESCDRSASSPALRAGLREVDTFYGASALAGSCGGEGAPELLVPIHVESPVTLIAVLEELELNAVMYLRGSCSEAASELACYVAPRIDRTPDDSQSSPPALVVPLTPGDYTLVIDGYEPSEMGAATLRVLFAPPK